MQNIISLNACMTYTNEKSKEFHKKFGDKTVIRFSRSGCKFNTWHEMIWVEKVIEKPQITPKDVILFSQLNLK